MEALLSQESIPIVDAASVALVRERVREEGAKLSLPHEVTESVVLVASELAHNQRVHGYRGRTAVVPIERDGVPGLEVIAVDVGKGIEDPTRALEGAPRGAGSLGFGLASAREKSLEIDIDVRIGERTAIFARRFAEPVPRRREVGIYGRALAGEVRSGDGAAFVRRSDTLVLAVVDGLGHGEPAAVATDAAMRAFGDGEGSPPEIIDRCHRALVGTRGAVMSVASVGLTTGAIEVLNVGNVAASVYGPRTSRRFGGRSFVLGSPQPVLRGPVETTDLGPYETLVVFTDGIVSRMAIEDELDLFRLHPVAIAHQIVTRFARDGDDALVVVVR